MSREQFVWLLKDLGNAIGIEGLAPDDQGHCLLVFDQKLEVNLHYSEPSQQLNFFAPVGFMPENPQKETDFMRKLLAGNFFWRETFGSTLGYDPRTRLIVMAYEEPITAMTFDVFQEKLKVFVDTLELWKNRLEGKVETVDKKESTSGNFSLHERV